MSNIIGEPFNSRIIQQIDIRQKYFGGSTLSTQKFRRDQIQLLHNSNAFVKLASSVNVNEEALEKINLPKDLKDNKLAQQCVLFNGISDFTNENPRLKVGLNRDNKSTVNNKAYGFGGLDFGQVPMPGITNVSIINKGDRGSLKEATISLKAYNYNQFNIIDILYLRLGYTVLLEIGHHRYISNEDKLTENDHSLIRKFLDTNNKGYNNYYNLLEDIDNKRLDSDGNYEALLGKITNFNWSFSPDGSYDITITLTSIGDVIESLIINQYNPYTDNTQYNVNDVIIEKAARDSIKIIKSGRKIFGNEGFKGFIFIQFNIQLDGEPVKRKEAQDLINNFDYLGELWRSDSNKENRSKEEFEIKIQGTIENPVQDKQIEEIKSELELLAIDIIKKRLKEIEPKDYNKFLKNIESKIQAYNSHLGFLLLLDEENIIEKSNKLIEEGKNILRKNSDLLINFTQDDFKIKTYIKLGKLCERIKESIFEYKNNNIKVPSLKFDLDKNFYYKNQYTLSSDPTKVYIINKFHPIYKLDLLSNDEQFKGNISDIYISIDHILDKIENNIDNEGNITLFKLLKSICDDINLYLGGVNKIKPVIDETTNSIFFIDETPLIGQEVFEGIAEFNIFKLKEKNGSFVKDFGITSKITNKLATQISIGAQAINSEVLDKATAFQSWNEGISDRIAPKKTHDFSSNPDNSTEALSRLYNSYNEILEKYTVSITKEQINKFISINKEIQKIFSRKLTEETELPSAGGESFIPISLNLKIHGLSGVKIYQSFDVETDFLPLNYRDKLKFIITKVNHSIQNNSWVTEIETLVTPKFGKADVSKQKEVAENLNLLELFGIELPHNSDTSNLEYNTKTSPRDNTEIPITTPTNIPPPLFAPLGQTSNFKIPKTSIRGEDGQGSGAFNARRGINNDGTKRLHKGIDLITIPNVPNFPTLDVAFPTLSLDQRRLGDKIEEIKIYSPIDGKIILVEKIYRNDEGFNKNRNNLLRGIKIQGTGEYEGIYIKIFYIIPTNNFFQTPSLLKLTNNKWEGITSTNFRRGKEVEKGQLIGYAQNMAGLYPVSNELKSMTNHIHYEVREGGFEGKAINPQEYFYDGLNDSGDFNFDDFL